jgi:hypothetical protein
VVAAEASNARSRRELTMKWIVILSTAGIGAVYLFLRFCPF